MTSQHNEETKNLVFLLLSGLRPLQEEMTCVCSLLLKMSCDLLALNRILRSIRRVKRVKKKGSRSFEVSEKKALPQSPAECKQIVFKSGLAQVVL